MAHDSRNVSEPNLPMSFVEWMIVGGMVTTLCVSVAAAAGVPVVGYLVHRIAVMVGAILR